MVYLSQNADPAQTVDMRGAGLDQLHGIHQVSFLQTSAGITLQAGVYYPVEYLDKGRWWW
ncbi:MAG: hypothetical protein IPO87_07845 [Flavobacteriales bacterium]|nr:hypothetical protein [Flavobacteriales bacterium]